MPDDNPAQDRVLRESGTVLALRILFLQLAVGLAGLVINWSFVTAIDPYFHSTWLLTALGFSTVGLQTIDALLLILLVLRWANTAYVIMPDSIVVRFGIWNLRTRTYKLSDAKAVEVQQSFIGKLLNYGSLVLAFSPDFKTQVRLENIPDPHRYNELIKKAITGGKNNKDK
jgi:hypothetical protein